MRLAAALAALLLCGGAARGQDVPLEVKGGGAKIVEVDRQVIVKVNVTVVSSLPFTVSAPKGAGLYFWSYPPTLTASDRGETLEITAALKGETTVSVKLISADLDKDGKFKGFVTRFGSVTFTVGDVPGPAPPQPPDPPKPQPGPAKAMRVLIVYETADLSKMPRPQHAVLFSKAVRDYLNAKCAKEPDGWAAYRIYDKDADTSKEPRGWGALLARPRSALPWLVVADGDAVLHEAPLPADVESTLALLKKFGG